MTRNSIEWAIVYNNPQHGEDTEYVTAKTEAEAIKYFEETLEPFGNLFIAIRPIR
jgi:hypothetical protein